MFRRTFLANLVAPCSSVASPASAAPLVIERAWFGPAERNHGHDALGIGSYPGRVHAIVRDGGRQHAVHLELAADAAFEDGLIRLADLDTDGSAELVLVAASPDISPTPVKARTASPLECPFIEVSNPDRRAGDAETKLYRRC